MFRWSPFLLRKLFPGVSVFVLLLMLVPQVAWAVGNPITVTANTATVHFPNYIDFQLKASDAVSPIAVATIFVVYGPSSSQTETQHNIPISKPANSITLDWHEDISPSGGNPQAVGTPVEYYWTLQDAVYHTVSVLPQNFTITGSSSSSITVTAQTDTVHFPQYIDFQMTAADAQSPITQASIYIIPGPSSSTLEHTITLSRPARTVTFHWRQDTSGTNFILPGTPVNYYWVVLDSANNVHTDTNEQFTTVDTRFTWQHLAQGMAQVNWYNRPENFGQLLLTHATTSLAHITTTLGVGVLHAVNLWIYQTPTDFHGALPPNSYEWVGGEAFPLLNQAFISVTDANDNTLIRDMPHELTHLVFHQHTAILIPTWFDEGMAVYNQFFHEPEMAFTFTSAVSTNSLLRLDGISDGFPASSNQAYLAYAQSWRLLDYMYHTFGQARMTRLVESFNNSGSDFNSDVKQALGVDQSHLENQWHISLNLPPTLPPDQTTPTTHTSVPAVQPLPSLTDSNQPMLIAIGALLILLPVIGICVLLFTRRRRRQAPALVGVPTAHMQAGMYAPPAGAAYLPPAGAAHLPPARGPYFYPPNYPQGQAYGAQSAPNQGMYAPPQAPPGEFREYPPPYTPYQEYSSQPRGPHTPQE